MKQSILLVAIFLVTTTLLNLSHCRDVRVKPVEHCDIDDTTDEPGEWTLNGPQGKTIILKYILLRQQFVQFHLSYNHKTILLAKPTGGFTITGNDTRDKFDIPDEFTKDDNQLWFELKVKNLTKSPHEFTSNLIGHENNETDCLTIVVKDKNYVPSKEDSVSLTAGIVMVVLMICLIVFFVVLYRNDNIIGGKYSAKMQESTAAAVLKKKANSVEKGAVNQGVEVEGGVAARNSGNSGNSGNTGNTGGGGVSMNVGKGEVEMHDVPLYSDEDEEEKKGNGSGVTA